MEVEFRQGYCNKIQNTRYINSRKIFFIISRCYSFVIVVETESHVSQAGLQFPVQLRMTLNPCFPCVLGSTELLHQSHRLFVSLFAIYLFICLVFFPSLQKATFLLCPLLVFCFFSYACMPLKSHCLNLLFQGHQPV